MNSLDFIHGWWSIIASNRPPHKSPNYNIYKALFHFFDDNEEIYFPKEATIRYKFIYKGETMSLINKDGSIYSFKALKTKNRDEILFKYDDGFFELLKKHKNDQSDNIVKMLKSRTSRDNQ